MDNLYDKKPYKVSFERATYIVFFGIRIFQDNGRELEKSEIMQNLHFSSILLLKNHVRSHSGTQNTYYMWPIVDRRGNYPKSELSQTFLHQQDCPVPVAKDG